MPATQCRLYKEPEAKAAWIALESAEIQLEKALVALKTATRQVEKALRNADGCTPTIGSATYFLDDQWNLRRAPTHQDGTFDVSESFHRDDYEGLSIDELKTMESAIMAWFESWA